ncbi:biotin--[acetyl-CoA-carboxylase] ligase [Aureimonas psammosilenae]|uniref:biotin--[acetyl-CoA-carboxylase] ligase n=1 Tax=Aureimonas psammosilenae TaxID=2495496 RepID=UPI001260D743|nr:biotin--[acetyl-CoA-carboxylase] ligase [Aureimonas psammosilenae]
MTAKASKVRRHLALDEVGSTNTVAMEAARSGDPGPLWVTAARQAAGRGRRARTWVSERGNLYSSLLLINPSPQEALHNLPLVVSLGLCEALSTLPSLASAEVSIKWPNDVLIGGRKCAGILIESERLPDGRTAVVAGCGVNVANVPSDTPYPVTGLRQEGCGAEVDEVFAAVAASIEGALAFWDRGGNFAAIRERWIANCAGIGAPCRVNLQDRTMVGTFVGLDREGRLLLKEDDGAIRLVSAGDVFPLGSKSSTPSIQPAG